MKFKIQGNLENTFRLKVNINSKTQFKRDLQIDTRYREIDHNKKFTAIEGEFPGEELRESSPTGLSLYN